MSTVWLSKGLLALIDRVKRDRLDASRSQTVRYLILKSLADLDYLDEKSRRALGL